MTADAADIITSISEIADAMIATASPTELLERCGNLLERWHACPARLYLVDPASMTYYPVAGWGCEAGEEEIEAAAVLLGEVPGALPLTHRGDPMGMLVVAPEQAESDAVRATAAMLGPVLDAAQEREATLTELRQVHERVGHLLEAGRLLQHLDLDVLLVEVLQTALNSVQAEVGAILIADADQPLEIQVTWGLQDHHISAIKMPEGASLVDHVHANGETIRVVESEVSERLDVTALEAQLTGVLALPLVTDNRRHGVLLLANPATDFAIEAQRVAETVTRLASIAIDNATLVRAMVEQERLERELDIARQVQAAMFPSAGLMAGRIAVTGAFRSCDETGGDYYTHLMRDGEVVTAIADVTGHGLGAALFTTIAHAMLQQQLLAGHSLDDAYAVLNQGLYHTRSGRFLTSAMVAIDTESLAMTYASAGHNPLLIVAADGAPRWLDSGAMPLGILPNNDVPVSDPIQLHPGDVMLLYTDGITEAMNADGECYGEEQLAALVAEQQAAGVAGEDLIDQIFAAVDAWAGDVPIGDDLTLVVIEVGNEEAGYSS